jgi:hypothetical protein
VKCANDNSTNFDVYFGNAFFEAGEAASVEARPQLHESWGQVLDLIVGHSNGSINRLGKHNTMEGDCSNHRRFQVAGSIVARQSRVRTLCATYHHTEYSVDC